MNSNHPVHGSGLLFGMQPMGAQTRIGQLSQMEAIPNHGAFCIRLAKVEARGSR